MIHLFAAEGNGVDGDCSGHDLFVDLRRGNAGAGVPLFKRTL